MTTPTATASPYSVKGASGDLFFPGGAFVADPKEMAGSPIPGGFKSGFKNTVEIYKKELAQVPAVRELGARVADGGTSAPAVSLGEAAKEYKRPNGEIYMPRKIQTGIGDMSDIMTVKKAHEVGIPVLLYGPPGTGKTALIEAALEGVITISGSGDTEVADFTGAYVQNPDGTFTWVDGPLVRAMENGLPLLIDEVALIDPRVMSVVYSVMDGRDELVVTANPSRGVVKAKPGFYVSGACNPDVPGAVMSEALMSRFLLQIEVLTDFDLATKMGVVKEIVVVAKNLKRKHDAGEIMRSPQMRELLAFKKVTDAFGLPAALANFISIAEPADRTVYVEAISSAFGKKYQALTIQ